MKWLLLMFILDVSTGMRLVREERRMFGSEALCEDAGQQMSAEADYDDPDLRSISLCLPESVFDE